jgi:hypothetical protein
VLFARNVLDEFAPTKKWDLIHCDVVVNGDVRRMNISP